MKISSVKWSVLAHLKSQPRGQNFQAQIYWSVLAHIIVDSIKYQKKHLNKLNFYNNYFIEPNPMWARTLH